MPKHEKEKHKHHEKEMEKKHDSKKGHKEPPMTAMKEKMAKR